jgi:hypothetical protein
MDKPMADKDTPETPEKTESETASPKKSTRKAPVKKAAAKKVAAKKPAANKSTDHVTVQDMHDLLNILRDGLDSRDKVVEHLQQQIALNQEQVVQNKKILARRSAINKWIFVVLAMGMTYIAFDQHTIIKTFDKDMTAMRVSMESMSKDMHSMSGDFGTVAKDVSSISVDVKSMSHGVRGMSRDTREMNRSMDIMTPPWSPFR